MLEVVNTQFLESRSTSNGFPRTLQAGPCLVHAGSSDDISADPRQIRENPKCGGAKQHSFATCLGVAEEQRTAFEIDLLPSELEYFSETTTREKQQSDRRNSVRGNSGQGSCPAEWCSWAVARPLASAPSIAR